MPGYRLMTRPHAFSLGAVAGSFTAALPIAETGVRAGPDALLRPVAAC